ncbi:hypothetical protein KIN20_008964 [Parelaphostrongylus tenuis]|uniref:Uncharacterized protein n=1 Tax=Parelaphostrongylus tenuis TaxID=148309 RepID=A0AAD5MAG1_PARTN|nr:hypothetical protein KIN20_008964 [Parelaphostrongylus tenuis]
MARRWRERPRVQTTRVVQRKPPQCHARGNRHSRWSTLEGHSMASLECSNGSTELLLLFWNGFKPLKPFSGHRLQREQKAGTAPTNDRSGTGAPLTGQSASTLNFSGFA